MTNKEIIKVFNGLMNVREAGLSFPARTSYAITRNLHALQPIVEDLEIERFKVLQTYGTPSEEKPGMFMIPAEQQPQATKELNDLENLDVEVSLLKIKLEDLGDANLSLEIMDGLYPLIMEEEG